MEFRRYDHVERLKHEKVEGIELGNVYVFPKLDGTNASVWFEKNEEVGEYTACGSRTRTLSSESDNAGFWQWAHTNQAPLWDVFNSGGSNWIIYGEWLVPHTLKTYREDAWRRFFVFDVYDKSKQKYLSYEEYEPTIKAAGLDVIEPLCIITNPSDEQLQHEAEVNTYLILDGAGAGEGIVLKNYGWNNRWGEQPWAKIVRNEFKEENKRAFGTTEKHGQFQVEAAIAEEFVTQFLVKKTLSKILCDLTEEDIAAGIEELLPEGNDFYNKAAAREVRVRERHRAQVIPRLLGTVFFELVNEEIWMALKKHKFPVVDFRRLRSHSILWTKKYAADLF
jgi:hypothetical protein